MVSCRNMILLGRWCVFSCLAVLLCADRVSGTLPRYLYNRLNENQDNSATKYSEAINRLSQVFEIDKVPSIRRRHKSPPQYMQELFNSIADEDGITRTKSPFDANVVRGFPDRDSQHQMHFRFNISSFIKSKEKILEAEFHLFKMRPRPYRPYSSHRRQKRSLHLFEIRVYQVLDAANMYSRSGSKLLDVRRTSAHGHSWEVFTVKTAVEQWLNRSSPNNGFLVTASSLSGEPLNSTIIRFAQRGQHHESKQPVLVTFADDGRTKKERYYADNNDYVGINREFQAMDPSRHRNVYSRVYAERVKLLNEKYHRSDSATRVQQSSPSRYRQKRAARSTKRGNKRSMDMKISNKDVCDKHEMYVDFEKIGWSDWIISPTGYNAFHCKGDCPFPLGQTQKPTNHATVQSIVHTLKIGQGVSMPCCVPNKLFSISLLYFDDDENVILKQYDDMVAASCGCH
ncbi:bone morphogenetic protein 2-like [Tubulanus polymorphus]|uniref:bone morphogenetic protein 2-like n=1 Tax=Tubulanus polymorphus TaxID=672921 RepID=UPI003DA42449